MIQNNPHKADTAIQALLKTPLMFIGSHFLLWVAHPPLLLRLPLTGYSLGLGDVFGGHLFGYPITNLSSLGPGITC